jgi:hypothetical protein
MYSEEPRVKARKPQSSKVHMIIIIMIIIIINVINNNSNNQKATIKQGAHDNNDNSNNNYNNRYMYRAPHKVCLPGAHSKTSCAIKHARYQLIN